MGTDKKIATMINYSPKCGTIFWEVKDYVQSEDQEVLNDSRKRWIIESIPHKVLSKRFLLRIHN